MRVQQPGLPFKYLTDTEQLVWGELAAARGKLHAADISERLGIRERAVREAISTLVTIHHKPIVSEPGVSGGFYIPRDPAEFKKERTRKLGLALQAVRRARAFDKTGLLERAEGQVTLALEG